MARERRSPAVRMTRLAVGLVGAALLSLVLLGAVWFAAPGLLARKAAHRVTVAAGNLQVDGKAVDSAVELFATDTTTHHVTRRQLGLAFKGAAGTLEGQIGRPAVVKREQDGEGRAQLAAVWEFANGYVELTAGSDKLGEYTRLKADVGRRPKAVIETTATMDDVKRIWEP